nr:ACT domain-containing protein ACR2 [Ipomoea batatas]
MTDPSLGARVSTLCDHESPPIDFEAAIPIKGSPNANTRTKAKVITFFSPGLVRHELKDVLKRLKINQIKSHLMKWSSCRLAVLGLVMTWVGYDIGSGGHECASSVGSTSQANLWGQLTYCSMNQVCSPYFDPDFDSLPERIHGPECRITIDNDSLEDCTIVKIDSVNKQGLLLEVVQVLTDLNLTILKGYISSDAGWFMDVFHVKDELGNKITDPRVINYIQQAAGASKDGVHRNQECRTGGIIFNCGSPGEPTAIELTGTDRPGLFSEISAALADLQCNIVEAHAWSHNERLACVAYISEASTDSPIDDHRLAAIEGHLTTVLRATTVEETLNEQETAKTAYGLITEEGEAMVTDVERRLHQLMLSAGDFEAPSSSKVSEGSEGSEEEEKSHSVCIESCDEKKYSIVSIWSKDRRRLMFDTVCTLTDMEYVIFHASIDSHKGFAFQEYFIRHVDGCALSTESEKERVIKCLEAAMERRVCDGVRLELCANNRVGLLSDITRVLRENGLSVVRADVATRGSKAVNIFYVRDISGNDVDIEFVKSIKREMGAIDLAVMNETTTTSSTISPLSPRSHGRMFCYNRLIK